MSRAPSRRARGRRVTSPRAARRRAGFSVIELLVAVTIFAAVIGAALELLTVQTRGLARGADRTDAAQNLQLAAGWLARDLPAAGTSVPPGQPFLVYAAAEVVAFHADYVTNGAADPFAIYYDPDAPPGTVMTIRRSERIRIPLSTFDYPDTTYRERGGSLSPAELIVFFFRPDSSTPRPDDYALFRQVNARPPELVARNLLRSPDGRPFFQYLRLRRDAGRVRVDSIPPDSLPLAHRVPVHGSPADTGRAAAIDSVRGVRISLAATGGRPGTDPVQSLQRTVWLRNAGLAQPKTCGGQPLFGSTVQATLTDDGGEPVVQISWLPALDETEGERDVIRYVVWRRRAGEPGWGDPYLSVPAGSPSYSHIDRNVLPGEVYEYAVAAQDCTPTLSATAVAGPVGPIPQP